MLSIIKKCSLRCNSRTVCCCFVALKWKADLFQVPLLSYSRLYCVYLFSWVDDTIRNAFALYGRVLLSFLHLKHLALNSKSNVFPSESLLFGAMKPHVLVADKHSKQSCWLLFCTIYSKVLFSKMLERYVHVKVVGMSVCYYLVSYLIDDVFSLSLGTHCCFDF